MASEPTLKIQAELNASGAVKSAQELKKEIEGVKTKLNEVVTSSRGAENSLKSLTTSFGGFKNALGTLGLATTVTGLLSFAKAALDANEKMIDMADNMGLALNKTKEISKAFQLAGFDSDTAVRSFSKFSYELLKIDINGEKLTNKMKLWGINAKQAADTSVTAWEKYREVLKKIADETDPGKRAALARTIGLPSTGNAQEILHNMDRVQGRYDGDEKAQRELKQASEELSIAFSNLTDNFVRFGGWLVRFMNLRGTEGNNNERITLLQKQLAATLLERERMKGMDAEERNAAALSRADQVRMDKVVDPKAVKYLPGNLYNQTDAEFNAVIQNAVDDIAQLQGANISLKGPAIPKAGAGGGSGSGGGGGGTGKTPAQLAMERLMRSISSAQFESSNFGKSENPLTRGFDKALATGEYSDLTKAKSFSELDSVKDKILIQYRSILSNLDTQANDLEKRTAEEKKITEDLKKHEEDVSKVEESYRDSLRIARDGNEAASEVVKLQRLISDNKITQWLTEKEKTDLMRRAMLLDNANFRREQGNAAERAKESSRGIVKGYGRSAADLDFERSSEYMNPVDKATAQARMALDRSVSDYREANPDASANDIKRIQDAGEEHISALRKKVQSETSLMSRAFKSFGDQAASAIDQLARTGKFSFSGMIKAWIVDLASQELRTAFTSLMGLAKNALFGGAAGAASGGLAGLLVKGITSLFGGGASSAASGGFVSGTLDTGRSAIGTLYPKFASGGITPIGQNFMVGENGPEIMRMGVQGQVIPNSQISSMGGSTTIVNISAIDSQSVQKFFSKNKDLTWNAQYQHQNNFTQTKRFG